MGKRKSKTAKQKQAKARQKNGKKTSLGGVAVSKGMTSKFQQAKSSSVTSVQMSNGNGKKITEASVRQKLKATTKKVFMPTPSKPVAAPSGKHNGNNHKKSSKDDEQSEFRRQMASLRERQMAAASQKKKASKSSATTGKTTLSFGFQEASFSLQKTPQQMLQETTRQMETMTGVGQQGIGSFSSTPIRTNQSWAVATKDPSSPLASKNPFEALGGNGWDDDEDNDWSDKPKEATSEASASLFSMAPPTFSLLPRITPTPATSPHPNRFGEEEEEVDPDL